jgi:putative redox protein
MTAEIIYNGNLRTSATHLFSGTSIETDAPLDNQGLAERFSPTDLLATALGSCMLTIMGIAARTHNINIDGTKANIEKIMANDPRRVGEIVVSFHFTALANFTDKEKIILERAALNCPVHKSLSADMIKTVHFHW